MDESTDLDILSTKVAALEAALSRSDRLRRQQVANWRSRALASERAHDALLAKVTVTAPAG